MTAPVTEYRSHYLTSGGEQLPLLVLAPQGVAPRAVVVLFHGGGWMPGTPEQFVRQARLLAEQGVLAVSAGYRLLGAAARDLGDCVDDAHAAVEHARKLASDLGAPDASLFLGGGSAGGQLALVVALGKTPMSGAPCRGLVLFNPVVDLCEERWRSLHPLLGLTAETARALSPVDLVHAGAPPALVLHGTADELVPVDSARSFRDAMTAAGNSCALLEFQEAPHGFFNSGQGKVRWFEETAAAAVAFVLRQLDA